MGAAGTRERIIERNRYRPKSNVDAFRDQRIIGKRSTQTFKKKGDITIDSRGMAREVKKDGWN